MSAMVVAQVSDTTFTPGPHWQDALSAIDAMIAWCAQHGIDAQDIPVESTIVRDPAARTITYVKCLRDEQGRLIVTGHDPEALRETVTLTLDEPPAPWPDVVFEMGTKVRGR